VPIVQALHAWLEAQLPRVAGRSTLAEAIRYALSRWEGLTRFLHDGRIELDTNPVERAIRPVALERLKLSTAQSASRRPCGSFCGRGNAESIHRIVNLPVCGDGGIARYFIP
jgi:hypothetical protein